MIFQHNPCHPLWQRTHIPISPYSGEREQCLMWCWANMCAPISADRPGFCAAERRPDRRSLLESQQPWLMTAEVRERSAHSGALPASQLSQQRENRGKEHVGWFHLWQFTPHVCLFHHQQICNKLASRSINWKVKATFSFCLHLLNISVLNKKSHSQENKRWDFLWEPRFTTGPVVRERKLDKCF